MAVFTALAKDAWLVGAGLTLLSQGLARKARRKARATGKRIREAAPFTK